MGLGRRTFAPGEVLTASNVMNYLQDQAVMNFSGTAARGSAIGTAVAQGMVSYLNDTNSLEVYKTTGTAVAGWEPVNLAQSPNVIINGGFDIWQRGTSFTNPTTFTYTADRWQAYRGAFVSGLTISRQATGLTGFEYGIRLQRASGNTSTEYLQLDYAMESRDAISLAGKNVTLSFYARAGANLSDTSLTSVILDGTTTDAIAFNISGGTSTTQNVSLTTSWQRFSVTKSVASNSSQVAVRFRVDPTGTAGANDWFEVTGVQLEAGQTATPFRRNANSLQGELATCQRYYEAFQARKLNNEGYAAGSGYGYYRSISWLATKRVAPTVTLPTPTTKATSSEASQSYTDGYTYQYASNAAGNFFMLWNVGLLGTADAEL